MVFKIDDFIRRKPFPGKFIIVADKEHPQTNFVNAFGGTVKLEDGKDLIIVRVEIEGMQPYQHVYKNEIELYKE